MTTPQSFSEYRQLELDAAKINIYASVAEIPFMSKRYALKRYLGWSEEDLAENERLWKEERGMIRKYKFDDVKPKLADAGITTSGIEQMAPEGGFEEAPEEAEGEFANIEDEITDFGEE
jgi:hypothetical protein